MSNVSEVGSEAWCLLHPWVGRKSSFCLISLLGELFKCEMDLIGLSGEPRKGLCEVRSEISALLKESGIVQK